MQLQDLDSADIDAHYHNKEMYKRMRFILAITYVLWLQNQDADTSLHCACAGGHHSLSKELIEMYQLDPNAVNKVLMSNYPAQQCMDRS